MPKKRVIAFPMHEDEIELAARTIEAPVVSDAIVVGEIEESALDALRNQGLLVQELDTSDAGPTTRPVTFGRESVSFGAAQGSIHTLRLRGPLMESWRGDLDRLGVEILEARPRFELEVKIPPGRKPEVDKLPFLIGKSVPVGATSRRRAGHAFAVPRPPDDTRPVAVHPFDILLRSGTALAPFLEWLETRPVTVAGARGAKVRVHLPDDSPLIDEIRDQVEWVDRIEEFVPPTLHNDVARRLLGIDAAGPDPAPFPFEGAGQMVAVADTGIDQAHPDFAGRIAGTKARGRPPLDSSDPHGHGTHVAGSVLGDGAASGGRIRGSAPRATLFFQSLLDPDGGLGGLPFTLDELFEEAWQAGARIHNNSWGAATSSSYRITSGEVDDFVHKRRDMLIVISAGNDGSAADPPIGTRNTAPGFVDWLSIGSPATCKNALTVGASRSGRTEGGFAALSYGAVWPDHFPAAPIADQLVSADPEAIGGFSSRGPCDDYRIKPDVVAPGTDILSCRSSGAPLGSFWGPWSEGTRYAYMGGTSMAAPLVSGAAALVREYYLTVRNHQPSAALLKATLINGTRRLAGPDAVADYPDIPNYHQGFGAIYLPTTIPTALNPDLNLAFLDEWADPARHFTATGRRRRFRIGVAGGTLRLCLAYTDAPGRGVQNNLDLLLEIPGVVRKRFGNEKVPRGFNGPDPNNNVEVITVEDAPPGDYLVQISATNILKPAQDFALVVTGRLTSPLIPA